MPAESGGVREILSTPTAQAVVFVAIALIASFVAIYLLLSWRDRNNHKITTNDHLTEFREMHQRGMISESEFRTIKRRLGSKLREEVEPEDAPH